jgi:hypothetical protein
MNKKQMSIQEQASEVNIIKLQFIVKLQDWQKDFARTVLVLK